ncbi:MAG: hypothetical protein UHD64_10825, partial [Bacteroidales bacterium]|nr:hypothetical protein [Bacteroidales bacterium]
VIPTVIPLSLKLPVGLEPSTLTYKFTPSSSPNLSHLQNGVPPSSRETIFVSSTGMHSLNFHKLSLLPSKMSVETSLAQMKSFLDYFGI